MRVIAGSARGRRIAAPPGLSVRPTAERVRQATFNALVHRGVIDGARVLDLFAGTGALGIEALSRGAAHATFVENDRTAQRFLTENLTTLGFADRATVVRSDATRWASANRQPFDVVFADPPYAYSEWPVLLDGIALAIGDDGIAVLESHHPVEPGLGWETVRQQRYGGTTVTLAVRALPGETSETSDVMDPPDARDSTESTE